MSKLVVLKKVALSSIIFLAGVPAVYAGHVWPLHGSGPDSLWHNYGQYQWGMKPSGAVAKYLHNGIDLRSPAGTSVYACHSGYVTIIKRPGNTKIDSAYAAIGYGDTTVGSCWGWVYTHTSAAYWDSVLYGRPVELGDSIAQDQKITEIHPFPTDTSQVRADHLHLDRAFGVGDDEIGFWPFPGEESPPQDSSQKFSGGEPPRVLAQTPPKQKGWTKNWWPARNPLLHLLPARQDSFSPFLNSSNPILMKRDSTESGLAQYLKKYLPYSGRDSVYILNRRADVIAKCNDRLKSGNSFWFGTYDIYYRIGGFSTQGLKGFQFVKAIGGGDYPQIPSPDSLITKHVYDSLTTNDSLFYCISNTDSITTQFFWFDDVTPGYWNTKQHKERAWNGADAESLSGARFPDQFYRVIVEARDYAGNSTRDSIKVIVNNFPPLVKKTYPDSGVAGVPRACTLRVWFDQPMDTVSTKAGFHLRLKDSTADVPGTAWFYSQCDTLMLFKPDSLLLPDTLYSMRDSTSTKDIADSALTLEHVVWFSTRDIDLHVSASVTAYPDSNWIEVRDSLLQVRTPRQQYAWSDTGIFEQRIAFDRDGNRYVCRGVNSGPHARIVKYSPSGDSVASYLDGIGLRGLTCDGSYLYAVRARPVAGDWFPIYRIRVIKVDLATGDTTSFVSPDSVKFHNVSYCPTNQKLYLSGWSVLALGDSTYLCQQLRLYRYTTAGDFEALWGGENPTDVLDPLLTVGKDRAYLVRGGRVSYTRQDTVVMYDLAFNQLGLFLAGDGGPGGDQQLVNSLIADRGHLYTLNRSYNGDSFYWVHVFNPEGSPLRACSLSAQWGQGRPFRSIAVYPSILGTPGMNLDGGGGGGGGIQAAEVLNTLLPRVYALGQSYPNPATGDLRINYALPKESQVSLKIYNVAGQLVRALREGKEKPGYFAASWDRRDQQGKRVASGVYLYRMQAGDFAKTRKLVIVR